MAKATHIYRVALERSTVQEASIDLAASSPAEARELAMQRADDGLVAWVEVHFEQVALAEEAAEGDAA